MAQPSVGPPRTVASGDLHAAAAVDVRPQLGGHKEVKFKEELLLARDRLGGMRSVYSHGCVLISPEIELERGIDNITRAFPTLQKIDILDDKVNKLPGQINSEIRDITKTLADVITATKQQPPQVILMPAPPAPAPKP